ncbi:MAG: 4-(cytidine 5'-diphospho)-2-C-methyl-D-erythritol kinase [Acidobacteriota bacterium]
MPTTFRSFAKVNLHLQVMGRRGDGYHELRTVFQTIDLHDLLSVEVGGSGVRLEIDAPSLAGPENLASRAARAFLATFGGDVGGLSGVGLRIEKRIPVGGGLGGGSSNAATVLLALRELTGVPERRLELAPIARELGADVPYFLTGGTALGAGRGDEILPLAEIPEGEMWIVVPPFGVSTREVFGALGEILPAPLAPCVQALLAGEVPAGPTVLGGWNDLEPAAVACTPGLGVVREAIRAAGAPWVQMSGSGSTFLAAMDRGIAESTSSNLPQGSRVDRVGTLSRSSVEANWRP